MEVGIHIRGTSKRIIRSCKISILKTPKTENLYTVVDALLKILYALNYVDQRLKEIERFHSSLYRKLDIKQTLCHR